MAIPSQLDERYFEILLCLAAERQRLQKSVQSQTASSVSHARIAKPAQPRSASRPRSTNYFLQQFGSTLNDSDCETVTDDVQGDRAFSLNDVFGEGQLTEGEMAATQQYL